MLDSDRYKLVLGDAYENLRKIPDQSIDCILTDPPYNLDEYAEEIQIEGRENLSKTSSWDRNFDPGFVAGDFRRILKPEGNLIAFTSYNVFGDWHATFDARKRKARGLEPIFDVFQHFAWVKDNPPPSFRKVSFLNAVEQIVCCWNRGHTWNFTTQVEMKNWLNGPICMGKERVKDPEGGSLHPNQKPVYLLRKFVEMCTNPGDLILDPFGGVMSTGVAALELGRRFLGFEQEAKFLEAGRHRLENVTPSILVKMR